MPQGFKLGLKTGMKKNKNTRINVVAQCSCQSSSPSSFASMTIMNGPRNDLGLRFALSIQETNWHLGSWQEGFYEGLWGCLLKRCAYFMKRRSYSDTRNKRKMVKCFLNPVWQCICHSSLEQILGSFATRHSLAPHGFSRYCTGPAWVLMEMWSGSAGNPCCWYHIAL